MILSFKTNWADGQPTWFPERILGGMFYTDLFPVEHGAIMYCKYADILLNSGYQYDEKKILPSKLHTIREDKHSRWKAGNDIHFRIWNRTKKTLQFAPVVKCKSTQVIHIFWGPFEKFDIPIIAIDNKVICENDHEQLANKDGFETVDDFYKVFDYNFMGKIIHWTDLKY